MTFVLNKLFQFWDYSRDVWLWPFRLIYNFLWWVVMIVWWGSCLTILLIYLMFSNRRR